MKTILITGLICLAAVPCAGAESAEPLDLPGLMALQLPDVKIETATRDDEGYVRVEGVIGGTIGFEVLLPDHWNGRFAMGGGGGFVGDVQNSANRSVQQGYASAGTDTGHTGAGVMASWANDDVLAQVNFGHLAVHRTAEVAKAVIRAYYDKAPAYSYFMGCSRGGGQAMMASQRYPEDFDGIVAGAPAFNWTGFTALFVRIAQAMYPDPALLNQSTVSRAALDAVYSELMRQCDGQDGLEDGIIMDPSAVALDLDKVPDLTEAQRKAIEIVYNGVGNDAGAIYPGFSYGAEKDPAGWFGWISGPNPILLNQFNTPTATFAFGTELYKYFVFNDGGWDYTGYTFENWEEETRRTASMLNATDTNLSPFKERGGKLIMWHGWGDPALPPKATIDYVDQVKASDPTADEFLRLYLVPGCLHCGGGTGPSTVDWLTIVANWVENGEAPERVIATGTEKEGKVQERPLYPHPQRAIYKGEGDPFSAESFEGGTP